MVNPILENIRDRRSIAAFETTPIEEETIHAILEAGRWAPSWLNTQPWSFILITDQDIKERISKHVPAVYSPGIMKAPIIIAVCVNPSEDPYHFVEDGAVATQNMALAARSLGLASSWIGVFNLKREKDSAEEKIKEILEVPTTYRLISLLPIGVQKHAPVKLRKKLSELVYRDKFRKSI
jgi:nitroreductase